MADVQVSATQSYCKSYFARNCDSCSLDGAEKAERADGCRDWGNASLSKLHPDVIRHILRVNVVYYAYILSAVESIVLMISLFKMLQLLALSLSLAASSAAATSISAVTGDTRVYDSSVRAHIAALHDIAESCKPSGIIQDACCEYRTIESLNAEIAPFLDKLVTTSFFRYVKIDLNRGCSFWKEDHMCVQEGCEVLPADEVSVRHVEIHINRHYQSELPESMRSTSLSSVDYTTNDSSSFSLFARKCPTFNDHDFCALDDAHSLAEVPHVNLLRNPERFTGYAGDSAARVWSAIYRENCFADFAASSLLGDGNAVCKEKRVFYRLVSGLHSSISSHICDQWLDQKTGKWLRLGQHPERIQNMYFTYVVLLRSITKIAPYLESNTWCSSTNDQKQIKQLMKGIVDRTLSCPEAFDEHVIPSHYRLTQTELVALFNGFARVSSSLRAVERFRSRIEDQEDILLKLTSTSQAVPKAVTSEVSVGVSNADSAAATNPTDSSATVGVRKFDFTGVALTEPAYALNWMIGLLCGIAGFAIIMWKGVIRNGEDLRRDMFERGYTNEVDSEENEDDDNEDNTGVSGSKEPKDSAKTERN
ncbi:hypothetical protein HDU82_004835 [Entophlyctis luteolus]|nr:hypothetical protein HDU82_004835 [Entophlyctis luteolus]